ncbi:MAG: hypothetical protein ACI91F_001642, partial [Candidatus Binatia bacterium]
LHSAERMHEQPAQGLVISRGDSYRPALYALVPSTAAFRIAINRFVEGFERPQEVSMVVADFFAHLLWIKRRNIL